MHTSDGASTQGGEKQKSGARDDSTGEGAFLLRRCSGREFSDAFGCTRLQTSPLLNESQTLKNLEGFAVKSSNNKNPFAIKKKSLISDINLQANPKRCSKHPRNGGVSLKRINSNISENTTVSMREKILPFQVS